MYVFILFMFYFWDKKPTVCIIIQINTQICMKSNVSDSLSGFIMVNIF